MNSVFDDLSSKSMEVYIFDVVVKSKDSAPYLEVLEKALEIMRLQRLLISL